MSAELGQELTRRELEVVALVIRGYRNTEIARRLSVSVRTVDSHLSNIFAKTGARSRTELAVSPAPELELEAPAVSGTVRISVDLSPALYRKLAEYTARTGRDLGVTKLAQVEVVRAMIEAVDNDLVSSAVQSLIHARNAA
jgi:DNA-binding CsgD family transcriptional regulator